MRIPHASLPAIRLSVVAVFVVASTVLFLYFWDSVGGHIPFVSRAPYQLAFTVSKVDNLVPQSDVTLDGVPVGKVESVSVTRNGQAHVQIGIDRQYMPMHAGLTARIEAKTLVEETYVDLSDGRGAPLPDHAAIPAAAVKPQVQLNDVLQSLNQPTRQELSSALRSLGAGTANTRSSVSGALTGLGELSTQGGTALDALAAQSSSLEQLSTNTAQVLNALDTQQGEIVSLVQDANEVTQATSNSAPSIRQVTRELPGVLTTADHATGSLSELGTSLQPVVGNLDQAAPDLNVALNQLPETTANLRTLLPYLNQTLTKAPPTLTRLPATEADLDSLLPSARPALSELNPMLTYLEPYGPGISSFFTNFGQSASQGDANGTELRVMPVLNAQSVTGNPVNLQPITHNYDPYPKPGAP